MVKACIIPAPKTKGTVSGSRKYNGNIIANPTHVFQKIVPFEKASSPAMCRTHQARVSDKGTSWLGNGIAIRPQKKSAVYGTARLATSSARWEDLQHCTTTMNH